MAGYLTWLDGYSVGAVEQLRAGGYPTSPDMSDAEALWVMCLASLSEIENADQPPKTDWREDEMARYVFFGAVAAIVPPTGAARKRWQSFIDEARHSGHHIDAVLTGGIGLKLSPRLVRAFAHARSPKTDDWVSLARDRAWYFDLPHHGLLLGGFEVRAIFTHPDTIGGVAAVAVLTEPGSDAIAGRYAWMLIGRKDNPVGSSALESPEASDLLSPVELQQKANDFIVLSLLYYRSLDKTEPLPRLLTPARGSKIQRKLERRAKSLFVVHVLPEPQNNLGRPTDDKAVRAGWHLDHRVTVRGHFRWQPVGEGRSRRELRWIAEHHRGQDLPDKPRLIPLRQPHGTR